MRTHVTDRRDELIALTAARLHDAWRAPRALPSGGFEPRMKPDGEGGEVDIANTDYARLPEKWQADNRAAATSIIDLVLAHPEYDVETLADLVHEDWLVRNGEWAEPGQKLPYAELSAEEKQKYREVVLAALDVVRAAAERDTGMVPTL